MDYFYSVEQLNRIAAVATLAVHHFNCRRPTVGKDACLRCKSIGRRKNAGSEGTLGLLMLELEAALQVPGLVVHHLDHDPLNNDPANLVLIPAP